eukprot:13135634-Alexandrium_andersonii.AAC.1
MGPPTGREIGAQKSQGFKGWSGCEQGTVFVDCDVLSHIPTADIGHVRVPLIAAHPSSSDRTLPSPSPALRNWHTPHTFQDCVNYISLSLIHISEPTRLALI